MNYCAFWIFILNFIIKHSEEGREHSKWLRVTFPFLFLFTLRVTESSKRLFHHNQRLIIYRGSKGVCRRQLETAQGFAVLEQASENVLGLRRPGRKSRRHHQVLASHNPMTPNAVPCHGGNPLMNTTSTAAKYFNFYQFLSSFSTFLHWEYVPSHFLSLGLLSKQSPVCLFTCQVNKTT